MYSKFITLLGLFGHIKAGDKLWEAEHTESTLEMDKCYALQP